jgi:hypothetical protein
MQLLHEKICATSKLEFGLGGGERNFVEKTKKKKVVCTHIYQESVYQFGRLGFSCVFLNSPMFRV